VTTGRNSDDRRGYFFRLLAATSAHRAELEPVPGGGIRRPVMHMKVDHTQFVIDGDRLTHQPTGAVFWMGDKNAINCEWGQTELTSGHDYDRKELHDAAREIFLKEKSSCT
jgi:hypothetical protein